MKWLTLERIKKHLRIEPDFHDEDEMKILRKTLAKVLKGTLQYDSAEYAEFKAYNEFAESIDV